MPPFSIEQNVENSFVFSQHPFMKIARPLTSLTPLIVAAKEAAKEAAKNHWINTAVRAVLFISYFEYCYRVFVFFLLVSRFFSLPLKDARGVDLMPAVKCIRFFFFLRIHRLHFVYLDPRLFVLKRIYVKNVSSWRNFPILFTQVTCRRHIT